MNDDAPLSYRLAGKLIPGDWFVADGIQYMVLEPILDGVNQLADDPRYVAAVHLGTGQLTIINASDEVVWIKKSKLPVRDWDEERGKK